MSQSSAPGRVTRRIGRSAVVVAGVGAVACAMWFWLASDVAPPKSFWISDRVFGLFVAPEGARVDGEWNTVSSSPSLGSRIWIRPRATLVRRWLIDLRAKMSGRRREIVEFEDVMANPGDQIPYVMLRRNERSPSATWYFCVASVTDLPETERCPPAIVGTWVRETTSAPASIDLRADGTFSATHDARVPEGRWGVSDGYVLFESSLPSADPRWQFSVALWEPARNELTRIDPGSETKPNEVYHRR